MMDDSRYGRLTLFRAAALQGMLANPEVGADGPVIASVAVKMADAMMAEADKADKVEREKNR